MTVYVDDAGIPASVRNGSRVHTSAWCHLTADTQEELHEFAQQLGLRREWFQPGRQIAGKPSPFWHYDVTAGKRALAIRIGAQATPACDLPAICRAREAAQASPATEPPGQPDAEDGICPGCSKSKLTYGRTSCQACAAAAAYAAAPHPQAAYRNLSHGQPGHMCVLPRQAGREAEAGS
jgi:hypothetical protein